MSKKGSLRMSKKEARKSLTVDLEELATLSSSGASSLRVIAEDESSGTADAVRGGSGVAHMSGFLKCGKKKLFYVLLKQNDASHLYAFSKAVPLENVDKPKVFFKQLVDSVHLAAVDAVVHMYEHDAHPVAKDKKKKKEKKKDKAAAEELVVPLDADKLALSECFSLHAHGADTVFEAESVDAAAQWVHAVRVVLAAAKEGDGGGGGGGGAPRSGSALLLATGSEAPGNGASPKLAGSGNGIAVRQSTHAGLDDERRSAYAAKEDKKGKKGAANKAERMEGFLSVKQHSKRQHWCVLDGYVLKWYPNKKAQNEIGEIVLVDCIVDVFDDVIFVQDDDHVYDFQAKNAKEAELWAEALKAGAMEGANIEKKTPLFRYHARPHYPVSMRLTLNKGTIVVSSNTSQTIEALKELTWERAREANLLDEGVAFHQPDFFFLRFVNTDYFLLEEKRELISYDLTKLHIQSFVFIHLEFKSKMDLKDEGVNLQELLIGDRREADLTTDMRREEQLRNLVDESVWNSLAASVENPDAEASIFRSRMSSFRIELKDIKDRLPEYLYSEAMIKDQSSFTPPEKVPFTASLPGEAHKTLVFAPTQMSFEVRNLLFDAYVKMRGDAVVENKAEDFVLKVMGRRAYFISNRPMIDFEYIRSSLANEEPLELSLVELGAGAALENEPVPLLDTILAGHSAWLESETALDEASGVLVSPRNQTKSVTEIEEKLRVRVAGVRGAASQATVGDEKAWVLCEVYFGGQHLAAPVESAKINLPKTKQENVTFPDEWLQFDIPVSNVPLGTRCSLSLISSARGSIGWVSFQLFNYLYEMQQGSLQLRLWPGGPANPIGTCVENFSEKETVRLYVEMPKFTADDVSLLYKKPVAPADAPSEPSGECPEEVRREVRKDAITEIDTALKDAVWAHRLHFKTQPRALTKVLQCADWRQPSVVAEAHRLLRIWQPLSPYEALELFDAAFSDPEVRSYAVQRLGTLENPVDFSDLLLQLVQVLKHEPYHDSPLVRLLLKRALEHKDIVGYALFWGLKAEAYLPEIQQRFLLLVEAYLRGCGRVYRKVLVDQVNIMDTLTRIALGLVETPSDARLGFMRRELTQADFPERFSLPLFVDYECSGILPEKSKYMSSKKLPLWLHFVNADKRGPPVTVIYKVGDDLRQDVLTLQMLRLMDKLWKKNDLNLHLIPYGVQSTGDERGLVEVVMGSNTIAGINRDAGGAAQLFVDSVITDWLRKNNEGDEPFKEAQLRFARSCAGYAVATFVLGVGDRHNDNIMCRKDGTLFHIDFGHFLGHFKSKFGYKREKSPFVFTAQYVHVLGGVKSDLYKQFLEWCWRAYQLLRENAALFLSLFVMMISVGLPELKSKKQIQFLRDALQLDATEDEAKKHLFDIIEEARTSKRTRINDVAHLIKHS